MTSRLADYIEAGKALDADEREIAAIALQNVGEQERATIDAAWDAEIDRRVEEVVNGKVALVDGERTLASIHEMIAARRGA